MVVIKLRVPGLVDGAKARTIIELSVDYPDAASLPPLIMIDDRDARVWERAGGVASSNYRPYVPPAVVNLETDKKIIDV